MRSVISDPSQLFRDVLFITNVIYIEGTVSAMWHRFDCSLQYGEQSQIYPQHIDVLV